MGRQRAKPGSRSRVISELSQDNNEGSNECMCGVCRMTIDSNSRALMCDECQKWYCSQCLGIEDELYNILKHQDSDYLKVNCHKCKDKPSTSDLMNQISNMQSKTIDLLNKQFTKLESRLTNSVEKMIREQLDNCIDAKLSEHKKQIDADLQITNKMLETRIINQMESKLKVLAEESKSPNIQTEISEAVEEANREFRDREQRKSNLILFKLCESTDPSVEIQKKFDYDKVREIIKTLDLPEHVNVDIRSMYRLGDSNKTDRPLKIILQNPGVRFELLKRSRKLTESRDADVRQVVLSLDRTVKERTTYRVLKKEIKERETKGETDLFIRRGKIVSRPSAVKILAPGSSKKPMVLSLDKKQMDKQVKKSKFRPKSKETGAEGGKSNLEIFSDKGDSLKDKSEDDDDPVVFSDHDLDFLTHDISKNTRYEISDRVDPLQQQVKNIELQPKLHFIKENSGQVENSDKFSDLSTLNSSFTSREKLKSS